MNHFKLSISSPCHESWEGMTPNAQGRFCGQCQQTVTDFSGMSNAQVAAYMQLNAGKKTCGRFKNTQLQSIVIQVPEKVLYTQTSFRKVFMLALLVTMGATLLSCADDFGNKQPIEQVVITDSTVIAGGEEDIEIPPPPSSDGEYIMGDYVAYPADSVALPPPPPVKNYPEPKSIVDGG